MKKVYYFFSLIAVSMILLSHTTFNENGKAGVTGAPGETGCNASGCHTGVGAGSVSLTSDIPLNGFVPGTTYNMTLTVSEMGKSLFGMGLEALNAAGTNGGTLAVTNASTKLLPKGARQNVVHQFNGGAVADTKAFTFSWTAPAAGSGDVSFYFAGIAANGDGSEGPEDNAYMGTKIFKQQVAALPITASATATNVSCFGGTNGSTTVTASGGSTYTYLWSNGQTGQTATNLVTGTYTVTVTSGMQTAIATASVAQPTAVVSTINTPTPLTCSVLLTTITAGASGGTAPYTYAWSNSATTASISTTMAGNYTVTITDSKGCISVQMASVVNNCSCPVLATAPANVTIVNSTCSATCTVTTGSIIAPTACSTGSTIQYSVNGGAWSSNLPTYSQTAQSIQTRCICNSDATVFSPASAAVVTVPADCPTLAAPTITIIDNVLPTLIGTISVSGCGAGTVVEYATSATGTYSATAPTYITTPITVFARCRNTTSNCTSPSVNGTTKPATAITTVLRLTCPSDIAMTLASGATSVIVNYTTPIGTSTCTTGVVTVTKTSGLASGTAFPIGVTSVCYTATDGCGNVQNCCFKVTVNAAATGASCDNVIATSLGNTISISGITSANIGVQVFLLPSYTSVYSCLGSCGTSRTVPNLFGGNYIVKTDLYNANWTLECSKDIPVVVKSSSSCEAIAVSGGIGTIILSNLPNKIVTVQAFKKPNYTREYACFDGCASPTLTIPNLSSGEYDVLYDVYSRTSNGGWLFECQNRQSVSVAAINIVHVNHPQAFKLFPNPATESVNVDMTTFKGQSVMLSVVNQLGKVVKTQTIESANGNSMSMDLKDISNGIYAVIIQFNGQKIAHKLVVNKGN
jgi:Secretion system C-terminal sorting domain/HYR domain/SprB repeat